MRCYTTAAAAALCVALVVTSSPASGARSIGGGGTGEDCNRNGIPDGEEIAEGLTTDCNTNGIPDECDIASGTSADCNGDELPDECAICPPVDIVFVMDTSGSMFDEGMALCGGIDDVVMDLNVLGITAHASFLGITTGATGDFPCLQNSVVGLLGPGVPGVPGEVIGDEEDWGPATAIVAERFGWLPGAIRIVVPLSDEGAQDGDPCTDPGSDRDAILNAITIANQHGVIVSPIAASGSSACVVSLATDLATGTGGQAFLSTDPFNDISQAILDLVVLACGEIDDCNRNGIPDECEPDCNGNGIPDGCDGGCPPVPLDCEEFDRFEDLTAKDTLTLITNFHNPEYEQGYVYAHAVDGGDEAIDFDWLVGQLLMVDGLGAFDYAVNAVDYRALAGANRQTDLDGDGILDLNGLEYELTAGELLVPRFIGQVDSNAFGELILFGLSGGTAFDTTVDFLVYNDNEIAFSAEYTFFCWERVPLLEISGAFGNDFLRDSTNDDPLESLGAREYGWFRFDGASASSSTLSITDPAVYGVYVERVGSYAAADLPFEICLQSGHLLPRDVDGDNEEMAGEPSDEDCAQNIGRRKPASLLVFPEFNNRAGVVSLLTVTNTSNTNPTRVHFKYIGRYGNP